MFFIFLPDLVIDNNPFLCFFSQYISTRITCFGALALVTCCCILGYQQPFTFKFNYLFNYLFPKFGLKDLGNRNWAESGLFSSSKFLICPLDMSIFKCNVVQILAYLKPRS